jgi:hypothetical protein
LLALVYFRSRKDLAVKKSLPFLILTLCASAALAEPPPAPADNAAAALVNEQLVKPMQKAESKRSRFSRAMPVPVQRRVRVLDTVAQTDASGKQFVRFALDVRRPFDEEGKWEHSLAGCAYPSDGKVFVQQGEAYVSPKAMLHGNQKDQPGVCRAAPVVAVQVAVAR